jgi:hypothetical protein
MDGITPIRGLAAMLAVALLSGAAASCLRCPPGREAQPGEIVLLRDVAARPAYRMAPRAWR